MLQGRELLRVKKGQAVVMVCGPSSFAQPGLCDEMGVVTGATVSKWGTELRVQWEDGKTTGVSTLQELPEKGIGVYAYPELIG